MHNVWKVNLELYQILIQDVEKEILKKSARPSDEEHKMIS